MITTNVSRREMLAASAAVVAPMILPVHLFGQNAPSNRITVGFIGVGNQGRTVNLNAILNFDDAQVVALCDVQDGAIEVAREFVEGMVPDFKCVRDFREILSDDSIDVVVISTPDHWHVPLSVMALEAGKDVLCEKPTLTIEEGTQLVDAVNRHDAVFQMAMEDRSKAHFHKMIEWIRNGEIGDLQRIEVSLPLGIVNPREEPVEVPEGLDYNLWTGPAPYHPYSPSRILPHHWRNIRAYSSGKITDWGAHLVDTAQLAANAPGVCPVEVEGTGVIPENAMTDVPIEFDLNYRYANGVELNVRSGQDWSARSASIRCIGSRGEIRKMGWDGRLIAEPETILRTRYAPDESNHWAMPPYEQRNFLDCVKTREPTTYTAETMRDLCNTLNMGVIAIDTRRKLKWDNETASFVGDAEANTMRSRPSRDWQS